MKGKGTFANILRFAEACRGKLVLSVLFAILSVAGGLVPYWSVYRMIILLLDRQAGGREIVFLALAAATEHLIKIACYGISTTFSHISAYQILESIRLEIADKLMKAPLGVVMQRTAGETKSILVDRVETIELPLAHMIPEGISNLLLPAAVLAYMLWMNPVLALSALICVPLGGAVYAVMMRSFNTQYAAYMEASNHVNSVIVEYVEGIEVIKAFGQSGKSYEKFAAAVESFQQYTLAWFRSTWKLMNLGGAVLPTTLLGLLPAGMLLYLQGAIAPAQLVLAIILSMSIITPVSWFTTAVNDWKSIEYAVRDARALLDLPELPQAEALAQIDSFDVRFTSVSFAYEEEKGNVLHDISLALPQGSFTALVGPSGGGKSTLAKLIARFWDVKAGSITIGGKDIREIPLSQLSQMVSFVSQDNFLFHCSLLENIRLGKPDAPDDEVFAAARMAQCEEFIKALPHGWQTSAGEAGGKLSGGERQRIAIARAILKDAPIVILDEATAFTDPENEQALQKSISMLAQGKTLLVIAHRLSTIQKAQNIVLLQNGRIAAQGTQAQLLESSAVYRGMWQAHIGAKQWAASSMSRRV